MAAIVLIDCNNFFVSCEELYDPSLKGKPVCVLGNNDGVLLHAQILLKTLALQWVCLILLQRKSSQMQFIYREVCQNTEVFQKRLCRNYLISPRMLKFTQ